jgi:hypothetical protein
MLAPTAIVIYSCGCYLFHAHFFTAKRIRTAPAIGPTIMASPGKPSRCGLMNGDTMRVYVGIWDWLTGVDICPVCRGLDDDITSIEAVQLPDQGDIFPAGGSPTHIA